MKGLRPGILRSALALAGLVVVLLVADTLCYRVTLPVEVIVRNGQGTLVVGGQSLLLGTVARPVAVQLDWHDPLIHEYQIDDTDSTNNFTLNLAYLRRISTSPYYTFQAWMRDLAGTSRWRDLRISADGHTAAAIATPANGARVALPAAATYHLTVALQRPETPMTLSLLEADGSALHMRIDRNDRQIAVTRGAPGTTDGAPVASAFFPTGPAPFAAMVLDFLVRTMLWALVVLLAVAFGDALVALLVVAARGDRARGEEGEPARRALAPARARLARWAQAAQAGVPRALPGGATWAALARRACRPGVALTRSLHPVALAALAGSLAFVAWIARVQYNAEPHVYDASAYLFAAKVYATGHLWATTPPASDRFPGAFMLDLAGWRFTQYPPGTSLALAPGVALGVPWLVVPLLSTLGLLAIGLTLARLYDRRVATLAVLLGTLSPFYSYLAASYLSHGVALCFLAWGFWALVRFAQGGGGWSLPLAAALFGMGQLTRDEVALLFAAIVLVGVLALSWRRLPWDWPRWLVPATAALGVALAFVWLNLQYNQLMTGSPFVSPRLLFSPGDHWGFGMGVGFYGQHTLAAGFVNLDELLTSLAIDLFGWPFYLTLAFMAVPFILRRATAVDWLMLAGVVLMSGAFIGYFYHGIYLGPRYLFETLPFLLALTARGILATANAGVQAGQTALNWVRRHPVRTPGLWQPRRSTATMALLAALVACTLVYYLPRQIALHQNFTGLPTGYRIDLAAVYHPPLHHAIVVTADSTIYEYVLFPLNDPALRNDVIYALAGNETQFAELEHAFPGRALYLLDIAPDGSVRYLPLSSG